MELNLLKHPLIGSGVSTDIWTCYAARIMAISIIPFIIVQLPQLLSSSSARRLAVLIALTVFVSMLISYCVYQVFQPTIQSRRIAFAKHKHVVSGVLKHLRQRALGRLLNDQGEPNIDVIKKLFDAIDQNKDSHLSASELKALIIGIRFDEIDLDQDDAVQKIMTDFDTSRDSLIDFDEFIEGISKWLNKAKGGRPGSADAGPSAIKVLDDYHEQTKQEHALLGAEVQSDESVDDVNNPKWNSFKAKMMLLLGTIIAAAFADPLVDAVDNFSDATGIPSFFVSFIALPLATNSSEAVSVIITVRRKKIRTASLTFSELYGNISTNNEVSLSVFLALVYMRELTWDFSAEVLVILIVCLVMGGLASFRTRFPLWTCSVAYILYPFSLALDYVLRFVFGWLITRWCGSSVSWVPSQCNKVASVLAKEALRMEEDNFWLEDFPQVIRSEVEAELHC
ncbi:hypothetical protein Q3G72_016926 [Acer saccharum]|nr:hypothetical protein Q3G72_016926 [Acer saccharum]